MLIIDSRRWRFYAAVFLGASERRAWRAEGSGWRPVSEHPYLGRILSAGGFKNYERAHLAALTKTLSPKLALPPALVRTVVEFYLHAGFYPFTAAKAPATAPAA